nr:GtrA family protein [Paenibacillus bovis]
MNMQIINKEFIKFIVVGCLNTIHYYVIYLICIHLFQMHYFFSHIIGFLLSLIGSFFLNCCFTYQVKPTWKKFLSFPLTQIVNTLTSTVLLFIFIEWFSISSNYAPVLAVFLTVPITFIITRRILLT